jgi:CBS domain-containing protein
VVLHYPVKNIIHHRHLQVVNEMDSVLMAIQAMERYGISALPVQDRERNLVGVISKSDIATTSFVDLLSQTPPNRIPVGQVMNRTRPVYVDENQPVSDAVALMHKRHIHRVFVLDSQRRLCGIISTTDIVKLLIVERIL